MPRTPAETALVERFSKTYGLARSEGMMEIERAVCGCDYGGTSWTTRDEAQKVAEILALGPGKRLLEVGAGAGWPGLYLAKQTGCDVALVDLPLEGLRVAAERAAADRLVGTCWVALADGAAMPFPDGCFDAAHHSDVLCCLVEKLAVLRSCRRVVGAGGRMVFSVIHIPPGLSCVDYDDAVAGGPPFVETDEPYPDMLRAAHWEITHSADLTDAYQDTVGRLLEKERAYEDELASVLGADEAADVLAKRHATRKALERGLLRRTLYGTVPVGET